MRTLLEKEGCVVSEAENGEVALVAMQRERPSLIFLDLIMPVMDGFDFADRVREHPEWRSIPIVVLTAHELTAEERRRINGYVEAVIQKSGRSSEELLNQVKDALKNCGVAVSSGLSS